VPLWAVFGLRAALRVAIASAMADFGVQANQFKPFCSAPSVAEVHHGGEAAVSCRLCLIACNSRKFTQEAPGFSPPASEEEASDAR